METEIRKQLEAAGKIQLALAETAVEDIARAAALILKTYANGGKVLLCGNGGSAADAQHFAAELVGRYLRQRRGYAAIALTTDTSILTAVANDFGYEQVFRRQVEALGNAGDCLVGISTSGTSKNVILAMEEAKARDLSCIAMAGAEAPLMLPLADVLLRVPSAQTPRIQEGHAVMGHILCDLVEAGLVQASASV